jgi:hypothetical protein
MQKLRLIAIFMLSVFLFSVGVVLADSSHLEIDKVEITSDGSNVLSTSSSSGSFDVDPGDELRIKIRLENTYDDDTDNDIEDVRVTAFIEDIDDGDDVDDSETVDVRADGHKTLTLKLKIPKDASSYESYDLEIIAVGHDQNGTEHRDDASYDVEVDREEHELVFETLQVSDAYCDKEATLRLELQNIGEEEEFDVELKVTSNELGTLFSDTFDLPSLDDEDESNIYSKTKRLDLDGLSPGSHTLKVRVLYDDGVESLEKSLDLTVDDCGDSRQDRVVDDREIREERQTERYSNPNRDLRFLFGSEGDTGETIVLNMPPPGAPAPKIPAQPVQKDSTFSMVVLVLANIALIVFVVLLVSSLLDRRQ